MSINGTNRNVEQGMVCLDLLPMMIMMQLAVSAASQRIFQIFCNLTANEQCRERPVLTERASFSHTLKLSKFIVFEYVQEMICRYVQATECIRLTAIRLGLRFSHHRLACFLGVYFTTDIYLPLLQTCTKIT